MQKDKLKEVVFLVGAVLLLIGVIGFIVVDHNKKSKSHEQQKQITVTMAPEVEAAQRPINSSKVKDSAAQPLANQPSPFSTVPTDSSKNAVNSTNSANAPNVTSYPNIPNVPGIVSLPGGIGKLPNLASSHPGIRTQSPDTIEVKMIMSSSSGKSVAVLSSGTEDISVSEGQNTQWGRVTAITKDGVYVGERFIPVHS